MRRRPSSRLLILNEAEEVLLFRFVYKRGPLAGEDYWSTPGGAVEEGESFEQAGLRELQEETGIECPQLGQEVARREFMLQLADGEFVTADERYFVVRPNTKQLSFVGWTDLETEVIAGHKWWSWKEIAETTEKIWPENLLAILTSKEAKEGSEAQKAVEKARTFLGGSSSQAYSEGHAKLAADGKWRCWFERQGGLMVMDPVHVIVLVDAATGACQIERQI